jgi:hypothetical protein
MPDDPLATVGQQVTGEVGNERVRLSPQRLGQHASSALTGDFGQRVFQEIRLAKRDDGGIFLHGVSILLWMFWQAQHPPRYAALSQPSSPSFRHSSIATFAGSQRLPEQNAMPAPLD